MFTKSTSNVNSNYSQFSSSLFVAFLELVSNFSSLQWQMPICTAILSTNNQKFTQETSIFTSMASLVEGGGGGGARAPQYF